MSESILFFEAKSKRFQTLFLALFAAEPMKKKNSN